MSDRERKVHLVLVKFDHDNVLRTLPDSFNHRGTKNCVFQVLQEPLSAACLLHFGEFRAGKKRLFT